MKYDCSLYELEYNENRITQSVLERFIKLFDDKLNAIIKLLKISDNKIHLCLMSKPELDTYVSKNSISYANIPVPNWLVGFSSSEIVCIIEMNETNLDEMVKIAIHESIHYLLYSINNSNKRLKLLDEGIATYFSGETRKNSINLIINDYLNNSLKNLSDFCIYDTMLFSKIKGYSYCYFIVECLYNNFGIDKILMWYKDQNLFLSDIQNLNLNKLFNKYIISKIKEKIYD